MDIKHSTHVETRRDAPAAPRPRGDANASAGGTASGAAGSAPATAPDRVTLTEATKALLAAQQDAPDVPIDAARIAALRAAIDDGSYTIRPGRIAEQLMRMENLL